MCWRARAWSRSERLTREDIGSRENSPLILRSFRKTEPTPLWPTVAQRQLKRLLILTWPGQQERLQAEKEGAQMESIVNEYISREIVQDQEVLPLSNDTSLLTGGILDSLSLLRLVVFLQERFKLTVDETDLLPENFDSVNTICAYLRAREPGKQEAARG
jgi:acyl carrier protein